jgi:hypothetical protein
MSAVVTLGPLAEEDYMRLIKMALEPKDRIVVSSQFFGERKTSHLDEAVLF